MLRNGLFTRSFTLAKASGHYSDPDGIKTSVATVAEDVSYSGSALDGVGANTCGGGFNALASWPTVSTAAQAAGYEADSTVTFTGTFQGVPATRTATIVEANGGETLIADGPLDIGSVTQIDIQEQPGTDGTFTFGWTDLTPRTPDTAWMVVVRSGIGSITVQSETLDQDTITLQADGEHKAWVKRILDATEVDVTVYE